MTPQNNIRILAAVMFADIVGYTKIMQEDEQHAKFLRDRQRSVINDFLLKYHGQVMQYYGDGVLMMFGSALDAANCGCDVQKELKKDPVVPVRVGIHIGDVMYDDEGIYGDAVNIAARVQSLGIPGSVMMSGKVVNEIKNHPGLRVKSFGELELKNVYMPVEVFAMVDENLDIPEKKDIRDFSVRSSISQPKSIAVLPFHYFGSDSENEHFSDGITEEIIIALSKIKGLKIASRTSVFSYKKVNKDIREIGKELNVSTVLEGSVRKSGNKIRVTAQLINTVDGFHIWSGIFKSDLEDIFDLQDEISQKIASRLKDGLREQDKQKKVHELPSDNADAYNYYLQGLYNWNKRKPEAAFKAIDFFDRAIRECDTYSSAIAKLANCYTYLGSIDHLPGETAFLIAEKHALRAVDIDPKSSEPYAALGYAKLFRWDFNAAEENLKKAITLEPENGEAHQALAQYYRVIGEFDQMIAHAEAALKIDPQSLTALLESGRSYEALRNYEKAIEEFNKALELDPLFRSASESKAIVFINQKKYEQALQIIKNYRKQIDSKYLGAKELVIIYARMGNLSKAQKYLELLKTSVEEEPNRNHSLDFAKIYTALGMPDQAFEFLQKAVDSRLGSVLLINALPMVDDLRDDSRFTEILNQIGLPGKISMMKYNSKK